MWGIHLEFHDWVRMRGNGKKGEKRQKLIGTEVENKESMKYLRTREALAHGAKQS